MASNHHVDYVSTYFPHKIPTRVMDEPTYQDLKRIKTELRANASSVDCELGGGDHGYLGLVLNDADYLNVPGIQGTNFVPPVYPGPLVIPPAANAVQAVQAQETHKEQINAYRECNNVEKALLKHLQKSLQPKYLESFVNEDTALLSGDIPTILAYLHARYGQVTGDDVNQFLGEVLRTSFTPADPLVLVWNPVEKLKKLAIHAEIPYSEKQLIEIALQVIRSTHDFEKALGDWESKATQNKTWDNLKSHFSQAQVQLKIIRGPTMMQAGFRQMNHIANEMREEFHHTRTELANMVALMKNVDDDTQYTTSTSPSTMSGNSSSFEDVANATIEPNVQTELFKLLKEMQNEIATLRNGSQSGNHTRKKSYKKTPDNPSFTRRQTDKYCWTHGGCAHDSNKCTAKAQGHKTNASFANKMGGSKAFCE